MSRKILAFALPLACALGSASSFAVTLSSGHFDFEAIPPAPIMTAVAMEIPEIVSVSIVLQPPPPLVFQSTVTLTPPTIVSVDHYSNSGTLTMGGSTISAVPLASGGLYLAGALLPLAARVARRRR